MAEKQTSDDAQMRLQPVLSQPMMSFFKYKWLMNPEYTKYVRKIKHQI